VTKNLPPSETLDVQFLERRHLLPHEREGDSRQGEPIRRMDGELGVSGKRWGKAFVGGADLMHQAPTEWPVKCGLAAPTYVGECLRQLYTRLLQIMEKGLLSSLRRASLWRIFPHTGQSVC